MAESKNMFIKSKMNKDLDDRLITDGEYRDALNINIAKSEGGKVGAIENIKGNAIPYLTQLGLNTSTEVIGLFLDEKNDRIFWFLTDDNLYHSIVMFDQKTNSARELVKGTFLNFNKTKLITGVNLLGDLLFWNDDRNQPRRINVVSAETDINFYKTEDQIALARFSPITAPLLVDGAGNSTMTFVTGATGSERADFLDERFARLSYRYKFIDNEYSTIAPFSQICFIPQSNGLIDAAAGKKALTTAELPIMKNSINQVTMSVQLPANNVYRDYQIKGIEILLKDANSVVIKSVDFINLSDRTDSSSDIFTYEYRANNPYKVLPESQFIRVSDNIPLRAKAQEIAGNRLIMANYEQGHPPPVLNYTVSHSNKPESLIKEYPFHNVKQRRDYQIGVVLKDRFGRESPVLLPAQAQNASLYIPSLGLQPNSPPSFNSWRGRCLNISFQTEIPRPFSKKSLSNIPAGSVTSLSSDRLTLTITNVNLTGILSAGLFLKSGAFNHTKIITSVFSSGNTIVTCDLPINSIYNNITGGVGKNIAYYNLFNDGIWHSYKIVVKQNQQEYYNVYHGGSGSTADKTYISLHGDNMNKIPIDPTLEARDTGLMSSSEKIYPKVLFREVSTGVFRTTQNDVTDKLISILTIGTAREHGLKNTSDVVYPWVYEATKNHLLAEIEDIPSGGFPKYGISRGPMDTFPSNQYRLSVFETQPVYSNLDIFWETSTSGLVEDLNFDIAASPTYATNLSTSGVNTFPESLTAGSQISGLTLTAVPSAGSVTFSVTGVQDGNGVNRSGLFEVVNTNKLRLNAAVYYRSGSAADLLSQKYLISVQMIDGNGFPNTEVVTLDTTNVAPSIILPAPGNDTLNIPSAAGEIAFTVTAVNGTAKTVDQYKDIVFSLSGTHSSLFSIDAFGNVRNIALISGGNKTLTVRVADANGLTGSLFVERTFTLVPGSVSTFNGSISASMNEFTTTGGPGTPQCVIPGAGMQAVIIVGHPSFAAWENSGFTGGSAYFSYPSSPVPVTTAPNVRLFLQDSENSSGFGYYFTVGANGALTLRGSAGDIGKCIEQ